MRTVSGFLPTAAIAAWTVVPVATYAITLALASDTASTPWCSFPALKVICP